MTAPLVSIVIPCYNAQAYVGEAITSALEQTYPNKEVIVIDDGSTDGSLEVIRSFGDRIRWETGPNRGGCAARNRGVSLAQGEFIQFLDADDLLHPRKLERQMPVVLEGKADLVFCDWEEVAVDGSVRRRASEYQGEDEVVFLLSHQLQTTCPIHRKQLFLSAGGFREELPCSQERDLHIRLACVGASLHRLPQTLLTVRRQSGSVSSDSLRVLDQHAGIAWKAYDMLRQSGRLTDARARALAGFLARDARHYLRHGLRDKALDYLRQAKRIHAHGGLNEAYKGLSGVAVRLLGPVLAERLVGVKRWLVQRGRLNGIHTVENAG